MVNQFSWHPIENKPYASRASKNGIPRQFHGPNPKMKISLKSDCERVCWFPGPKQAICLMCLKKWDSPSNSRDKPKNEISL
jgi:hypothetical protein